jgi:hypothetical protein
MIIIKTEIFIYLDNAPPRGTTSIAFFKKSNCQNRKKSAAKKALQRKPMAKKGAVAKNKKARNRLIVRL